MNMNASILTSLVRSVSQNTKYFLGRRIVKSSTGHRFKSYEGDGKTTVSILNTDPSTGLMIDSYSQMGFRLNNGMVVIGPMAIFPKTVLSWNIDSVTKVNEESLSLFCALEPKIDILILGVGDNQEFSTFNRNILKYMNQNKISVELLTTEQACTTFNFLNAERRYVAGALIPPNSLRVNEDDIAATKIRVKKIYEDND
ncbi:hypothetical protein R5R35_013678 [Gryllus longicercus]|uniref:NADH dehydrogenase [ubiquinone] 1 alpha subcomplex assembly factor 3 n=1 Tax=Gryllus longicercus TaxID=2509291 RepID=A0AAN9VT89_9ORTH